MANAAQSEWNSTMITIQRHELTPRQERFVQEYLVDLNATQAAIRAGYSKRTAKQQGSRLLTNVDIQAALLAKRKALEEQTGVTVERVIGEFALIGFADFGEIAGKAIGSPAAIAALPEHLRRLVKGWKWDAQEHFVIEFHDKMAALVHLGRHLGMFADKNGAGSRQPEDFVPLEERLKIYAREARDVERDNVVKSGRNNPATVEDYE